jgi:NTP pyrophosphatase (non-canonical NTP hydrolase)
METDLNKLRDRAYKCACDHGFHENKLSNEHYLMLIITEISEAVNADRKNIHADIYEYGRCDFSKKAFETFIKDSVEDELADVAIRLLDFAGARNVEYNLEYSFYFIDPKKTFCENCFRLCQEITSENYSDIGELIQYVLKDVLVFSKLYGIDLLKFVDLKMKYNELRPYKNGKKY